MNLCNALLPLLMGMGDRATATPSSSSSSSSRDVSSSLAFSSTADIHDIGVSFNDDAYGIKKKRNAIQARKKLHQLHDPSPSSELTNRHDQRINGDGSTRSDASNKQDIGYLDHRRLPEDPPSEETSQRHRELESREEYCDDLCPSGRPEIQANTYPDFINLITISINNNEQIGCWNTSSVTDMYGAFRSMRSFNQNINCWDVARVTTMGSMFYYATGFDQPLDDWNVASVTDMPQMFKEALVFNQPINDWNVASAYNMAYMFYMADSFDQPLDDWDVARVTQMREMFYKAPDFNQPLDDWDVSRVNNMTAMFFNATEFNQCITSWAEKISSTVDIDKMFYLSDCTVPTLPSSNVGPWCRDYDCVATTSVPTTTKVPTSAPTLSLAPTSAPTLSLAPTSAPTTTPTERPTGSPSASPDGACDKSAEFNCDKHSAGFKKRKCSKKIRKKWGVGLKFKDVCPHMCKKELCTCVDRVENFSIKGIDGDHTCAGLIDTTNCKKFTDNGFGVNKICPNRCQNTKKCIN